MMRFLSHAPEELIRREADKNPVVAMVQVVHVSRFPLSITGENKCGFLCTSRYGNMIQFFVDEKEILASPELAAIYEKCKKSYQPSSPTRVWLLVAGKRVTIKDNKKYNVKEARIPSVKIVAAYEHDFHTLKHTQSRLYSITYNESLRDVKNAWLFKLVGEESKNNTIFF